VLIEGNGDQFTFAVVDESLGDCIDVKLLTDFATLVDENGRMIFLQWGVSGTDSLTPIRTEFRVSETEFRG
jgi:hypothetical protein